MRQIALLSLVFLSACTADDSTFQKLHDPLGLKAAKERYRAKQAELGRLEGDEEYRKKLEQQQNASQPSQ
jgi:hypothetical protein